MLALRPSLNQSVLGLFAPSHLDYNYQVDGISDTMPTLSEMTVKAIELLRINPNGFFLFVEGGRIDHALHENHAHIALEETAEFSRAIDLATKALSFNDTLFVTTADHSHTLSLSGYPVEHLASNSTENVCNQNLNNLLSLTLQRTVERISLELLHVATSIPYHI